MVMILLAIFIMAGLLILPEMIRGYAENRKLAQSKVVLYEGPKSLRDATEADLENASEQGRDISLLHCMDTKLEINGQECFVYDTNVNHTRQWVSNYLPPMSRTPVAYFDFDGAVQVKLTVPERDFSSVKISPLSYNIQPDIDAQAIR